MIKIYYEQRAKDLANDNIKLMDKNRLLNSENKELKEQLVRFKLPDMNELESRLKKVVDKGFKHNEVVEKREYSLGFRACFNWLKIKQMKSKGN